MVRTPICNMPFSLVYGCIAVIPLEIQMSSLRVALVTKIIEGDNDRLRLQELEALDEKRLQDQQYIELYQARISKPSTKRSRRESFRKEIWS